LADAGDGAAGAYARDDDVNGLFGVVPKFLGGCAPMNFWVGWILELLRNDSAWVFGEKLVGLGDGALHAERAGRQHEFGGELPWGVAISMTQELADTSRESADIAL
jgi:hypothetical protein